MVGQRKTIIHCLLLIMPAKDLRPLASIYARYFSRAEKRALRAVSVDDCLSEINLLRVLAARTFAAQSPASAQISVEEHIKILRSYNILSEQIIRLIRVQGLTHNPTDELEKTIIAVLNSLDPYDQL